MATYKIVVVGLTGYGVEMTSVGGFHSLRGFPTEAAARQWIAEQLAADPEPGTVSEGPPDSP